MHNRRSIFKKTMYLFKMHSIGSVRPVPRAAALINANANANANASANWWNRRTQGPIQGQEPNPTPEPEKQASVPSVPMPGEDVVVIQEEEMVLVRKQEEQQLEEAIAPEAAEAAEAAPEAAA